MYDAILVGGMINDNQGRTIGLYRLRTALEKNSYQAKVIDWAHALNEDQMISVLEHLITDKTKMLGLGASWWFHEPIETPPWVTTEFFNKFKQKWPNIKVVVGASQASIDSKIQPQVDYWITGFSDRAIVAFLDFLSGKISSLPFDKENGNSILHSDNHYLVENIDDIETEWKLEDDFKPYQPLPIEISRGCIFRCAFCSFPFLGKKNYEYIRSATSIAGELKRNYELFGTYRYTISDDTFNDSWEKVNRLRQAIDIAKLDKFEFLGYIKPEILVTNPGMGSALVDMGLRGAHFGVESFKRSTRQAIGKGMAIDRVLDAAAELQSMSVRVYGTFIVGLPDETVSDCYKTNEWLIKHGDSHFRYWRWHALGINSHANQTRQSLFERNPQSFGYTIIPVENHRWCKWINNCGVSQADATTAEKIMNGISLPSWKIAGWLLGTAWFNNISDADINDKLVKDIPIRDMIQQSSSDRCSLEFKKLTAQTL